jgi:septal ring-binding cell division protein DamX
MSRSRSLVALIATLALAGACKKDKPPADTLLTDTKAAAPAKPPASAPTNPQANGQANTKAAPPANTKGAPNSKVVSQSAARPGASKAPMASDAAELAAAPNVRTVQVSSYASPTPANWWVGELKRQNIPAYMVQATINGQNWYRIRIGATLTGAEARELAAKIHARYKWPTWIVMVDDKSVFAGDELGATRAYLGSSR